MRKMEGLRFVAWARHQKNANLYYRGSYNRQIRRSVKSKLKIVHEELSAWGAIPIAMEEQMRFAIPAYRQAGAKVARRLEQES